MEEKKNLRKKMWTQAKISAIWRTRKLEAGICNLITIWIIGTICASLDFLFYLGRENMLGIWMHSHILEWRSDFDGHLNYVCFMNEK